MNGQVQLLGGARAKAGSTWVEFAPDQRYQLLAYLAYQGDWVSRDRLAFLFWADTPTKQAKQNFRQLLRRIRALTWLNAFDVDKYRVRWETLSDAVALKEALAENDLETALKQYGGPLLPGLGGDGTSEFDNWLELEREELHSTWREAVLRQAEALQKDGRFDEALALLKLLLDSAELDEEALIISMCISMVVGRPRQALRLYGGFKRRLDEELGLEPSAKARELARAIEENDQEMLEGLLPPPPRIPATAGAGEKVVASARSATPPLPKAATGFIGREAERERIKEQLADSDCRLLTLVGPGVWARPESPFRRPKSWKDLGTGYSS